MKSRNIIKEYFKSCRACLYRDNDQGRTYHRHKPLRPELSWSADNIGHGGTAIVDDENNVIWSQPFTQVVKSLAINVDYSKVHIANLYFVSEMFAKEKSGDILKSIDDWSNK